MKIVRYKRLFLGVVLTATVFSLFGCGKSSPEKVVKKELDLVKQLDEKTITSFVSYEDMMNSNSSNTTIGQETTDAVKLFFKHFDYKITSVTATENTATVNVTITNIDTDALAKDVCLALVRQSASPETQEELSLNSYFTLLGDTLSTKDYELTEYFCTIELQNTDQGWFIVNTSQLEDDLVSGFITYLKNPYLVSPKEMISVVCEGLKEKSPKEWESYLDMNDIFSTGSEHYANVDLALATQLSKHYDYEIISITENTEQNQAAATINITSLDMNTVLSSYQDKLLSYASTTESVRADDLELANKTAELLTQALEENSSTTVTQVAVNFTNNGSTWEIQLNNDFTNALIGNISDAISTFQNSSIIE